MPGGPDLPARRPPPPLRRATVRAVEERSARLRRITIGGIELAGLPAAGPAASVRLLLPHRGELVLPEWDGNEHRHADGSRPALRTLTPRRIDPDAGEVDVDIVLHGAGVMAGWAAGASAGDPVALAGTGRGYDVEPGAPQLLAGDESALPAIETILDALPTGATGTAHIEVGHPSAVIEVAGPAGVGVRWHVKSAGAPPGDALVGAVAAETIDPSTRVWAAGEAAAVQRIRRHLFDGLGLDRARCTVRGYWKHGRAGAG